MVEFRLLKEEEFEQAIALADQTFRDDEHVSMGEAFPQVFSPALNQSYGAFIDDQLVSFIGLVPSVIHLESAEIQAFSIGSVCTHPDHRRKGYASSLLDKVFSHVEKSHASLLFVSGSLPIYIKAGCMFYGNLNKFEICKGDLNPQKGYSVREFRLYDWFQLRKLLQSRRVYFDHSLFDLAILNRSRGFASIHKMNHKIIIAEVEHTIKGFVVLGVPESSLSETPSRVIEWAGDSQAIQAVLSEAFRYGVNVIKLSVPSYEWELNSLLHSIKKTEGQFPGTIKITNLNLLLEQLEPFLRGKLQIIDVDETYKKLIVNQKSVLFEISELEKLILQGDPNLDTNFKDIFPIPLPFPEGLNYV